MKICLYVLRTIKIYFPINTLLRKPNSNNYDKVVNTPISDIKAGLVEHGFLATVFIYNELNAICVGLFENNS